MIWKVLHDTNELKQNGDAQTLILLKLDSKLFKIANSQNIPKLKIHLHDLVDLKKIH